MFPLRDIDRLILIWMRMGGSRLHSAIWNFFIFGEIVLLAECFDLYFTGAGGARAHAKYLTDGFAVILLNCKESEHTVLFL